MAQMLRAGAPDASCDDQSSLPSNPEASSAGRDSATVLTQKGAKFSLCRSSLPCPTDAAWSPGSTHIRPFHGISAVAACTTAPGVPGAISAVCVPASGRQSRRQLAVGIVH